MVGVGTKDFDLKSSQNKFCSLIGSNKKLWGYSFRVVQNNFVVPHLKRVVLHHDGEISTYDVRYGTVFGKIGVRLYMWRGTLEFFYDRKPLGVAFENLHKENVLYPMICSTQSQTKFRMKYCQSLPVDLQHLCLKVIDPCYDKFMPPGLLKKVKDYWWIRKFLKYYVILL